MERYPPCVGSSEAFQLPPVFLQDYPDLDALREPHTRQIALAIYYHNRMIQSARETLSQGRPIRGLTETYLASILVLIDACLSRLSASCEVVLLKAFIAAETALLSENRRQPVRHVA